MLFLLQNIAWSEVCLSSVQFYSSKMLFKIWYSLQNLTAALFFLCHFHLKQSQDIIIMLHSDHLSKNFLASYAINHVIHMIYSLLLASLDACLFFAHNYVYLVNFQIFSHLQSFSSLHARLSTNRSICIVIYIFWNRRHMRCIDYFISLFKKTESLECLRCLLWFLDFYYDMNE